MWEADLAFELPSLISLGADMTQLGPFGRPGAELEFIAMITLCMK